MKARPLTDADREAQIVALWWGRPRDRRARADVGPFYDWLVDYAPWLVRRGGVPLEQVRALVESHSSSDDEFMGENRHRVLDKRDGQGD